MSKILTSIYCIIISVFFVATALCIVVNSKMQNSFADDNNTLYDQLLSNSNLVLLGKFEELLIDKGEVVTENNFVELLVEYCAEVISLDLDSVVMTSGGTDVALDSIFELQFLEFPQLETLIASNNKIKSIDAKIFDNMPKIKYVNLSNNLIDNIGVPAMPDLIELQLQYNNISEIDLSKVSSTAFVNLSHNKITNADRITVATPTPTVFLLNNNISNTTYEDGKNFEYFIQDIPLQANEIRIFKLNSSVYYPQLIIKFINNETEQELVLNQGSQTALTVGNYTLKFFNVNNELTDGIFSPISLVIKKNAPLIKFYQNNKEIARSTNVKKGVTIHFSGNNNNSEWVIQYQINNNEWVSKSFVSLNSTGSYTISCRMVNGEQTSEISTFLLKIDAPFNLTWTVIIVGFLVAIGVFIYLFKLKN